MRQTLIRGVLGVVLALGAAWVPGAESDEGAPPPSAPSRQIAPVVTQQAITLSGQKLAYTATAGYMPITDDAGKVQANIFYVAYVRKDVDAGAARPVTFAFNGGPGASSMWLHLGVGPKRVPLAADGTALPASTVLTDNEATWLGFTDLVFVDPIGTGFSRAAEGVDARQFYEVSRDIQVAGSFVRRYITQQQRWLSPKFILGESYGTTRAAGLVNRLQDTAGIDVNGVILVSSALDFQTFTFDNANDLPYALVLPSLAATAWYHKKLQGTPQTDLTETLRRAENWALNEYLLALAKGEAMSDTQRAEVTQRMAQFTGLAQNELARSRLRVGPLRFGKLLLRDAARIVGRFDGRVTSADPSPGSEYAESDPSFFLITGPLVEALNHYLQRDLQFRTDMRYEFLSKEVNHSWKWLSGGQGYLYVADELTEAMARDNRLRVFAGAGYFDLATPYLSQRYTFDHMGLTRDLRGHLTFKSYPTGHQIYTDPASALKLREDVEAFVQCAAFARQCADARQ
jgi:carboxypeptidase C (cathepsin A)